LAKNVGVAIRDKLELNPSVEEGGVVRIPLPRVSLEVRQQTAKALTKHTEKYRQRVRTIRRNVLKVVKQGEAGKLEGISKDDAFRAQKEIEDVTEKIMVKLNEAAEQKHKAIMAL
jgi:ribosome recycling factor